MMTIMPLLYLCFGCNFFVVGSIFEATSQSESGNVLTPADKGFFLPWSSNEVSSVESSMCDLPIRDLTAGGLADFWLLAGGYAYEDHAGEKAGLCLHP